MEEQTFKPQPHLYAHLMDVHFVPHVTSSI